MFVSVFIPFRIDVSFARLLARAAVKISTRVAVRNAVDPSRGDDAYHVIRTRRGVGWFASLLFSDVFAIPSDLLVARTRPIGRGRRGFSRPTDIRIETKSESVFFFPGKTRFFFFVITEFVVRVPSVFTRCRFVGEFGTFILNAVELNDV